MKEKLEKDLSSKILYTRKIAFKFLVRDKSLSIDEKLRLLRRMLIDEDDAELRAMARKQYDSLIRKREELGDSRESVFFRNRNELFDSGDSENKVEFLKGIESDEDGSIREFIIERLEREKDVFVLATLISTLGRIGKGNDAEFVVKFLEHDDPRVRANTVDTLRAFNVESTYENVIPLLSDTDARVRANVARFLSLSGVFGTIRVLKQMIYSGRKYQLESAIFALERMNHPQAEELLEQAKCVLSKLDKRGNLPIGTKASDICDAMKQKKKVLA